MTEKNPYGTNHDWGENHYRLQWFELLSFHKKKVVIYGVGQWYRHMMDWRGCNFYHGRMPNSPSFNSVEEAIIWLKDIFDKGLLKNGVEWSGHHSGGGNECNSGCHERVISNNTLGFKELEEDSVESIIEKFKQNTNWKVVENIKWRKDE